MNPSRIYTIAGRIMRQILRDRRACALIILAPLLIMTLLAVILKTDANPLRIAVHSGMENFIITITISNFLESAGEDGSGFTTVSLPDDTLPEEAIKKGLADAVLIIPDDFIQQRASGKRSGFNLVLEGADPMRTASIFSRLRKAVPESLSGMPKIIPAGCPSRCAELIPSAPPEIKVSKIYGQEIDETTDFFTPVLPPFFVFFFVFILSGLSFLRERTGGTAERLLASPLKRPELVCGYILGFLPPALIQAAIVILFARYILGGPWGGWTTIATTFLICLVAQCLGVFISAFARSEFQVFQFIPIIILPQTLLCGIIWPISGFPVWLKVTAYIFPLTYAVNAIRDTVIRGLGFTAVWQDMAILLLFTIASVTLAALSVRRAV